MNINPDFIDRSESATSGCGCGNCGCFDVTGY